MDKKWFVKIVYHDRKENNQHDEYMIIISIIVSADSVISSLIKFVILSSLNKPIIHHHDWRFMV